MGDYLNGKRLLLPYDDLFYMTRAPQRIAFGPISPGSRGTATIAAALPQLLTSIFGPAVGD
jgi:hypothetical protein